jgi:hypothetical protein
VLLIEQIGISTSTISPMNNNNNRELIHKINLKKSKIHSIFIIQPAGGNDDYLLLMRMILSRAEGE